ncbi:MAG: DUF1491 family protein [Alphaproteobacteria bacterium]|nr:DUF1491 family protein [Alphaproteobacteria bacterium]
MCAPSEDERLPTGLWVDAHIRRCISAAIPVYVVHKGAYAAGTVMVKIVMREGMRTLGCFLLNQTRDMDGAMGWMQVFDDAPVDERRADEYIKRAISRDPDVWVVEVEDPAGKNPFEGKIF